MRFSFDHISTNLLAEIDPDRRDQLSVQGSTYATWLNQVERFFALITQREIRRGSFVSVPDLVRKIDRFTQKS